MLPLCRTEDWFQGPGHYFWTSDLCLVDLELGFCATRQELEQAIGVMIGAARQGQEVGGGAYRTHQQVLQGSGHGWYQSVAQGMPFGGGVQALQRA